MEDIEFLTEEELKVLSKEELTEYLDVLEAASEILEQQEEK